jgi:preprotein translocase subunit SecD
MADPRSGLASFLADRTGSDARAQAAGVRVEQHTWQLEDGRRISETFLAGAESALRAHLDALEPELRAHPQHQVVILVGRRRALPAADPSRGARDPLRVPRLIDASEDGRARTLVLDRRTRVDISQAELSLARDRDGLAAVDVRLRGDSVTRVRDITSAQLGHRMAILTDTDRVLSAPVLKSPIADGRAQITLGLARRDPAALEAEARRLLAASGPALPLRLVGTQELP